MGFLAMQGRWLNGGASSLGLGDGVKAVGRRAEEISHYNEAVGARFHCKKRVINIGKEKARMNAVVYGIRMRSLGVNLEFALCGIG